MAVTKIGYVIPLAIFSTVLLTLGNGLYLLLQPDSATGLWVGFQIIAGVGSGAGLQVVSRTPRLRPKQYSVPCVYFPCLQ